METRPVPAVGARAHPAQLTARRRAAILVAGVRVFPPTFSRSGEAEDANRASAVRKEKCNDLRREERYQSAARPSVRGRLRRVRPGLVEGSDDASERS